MERVLSFPAKIERICETGFTGFTRSFGPTGKPGQILRPDWGGECGGRRDQNTIEPGISSFPHVWSVSLRSLSLK